MSHFTKTNIIKIRFEIKFQSSICQKQKISLKPWHTTLLIVNLSPSLRGWHTFGPVQKIVVTGMVHLWTSVVTSSFLFQTDFFRTFEKYVLILFLTMLKASGSKVCHLRSHSVKGSESETWACYFSQNWYCLLNINVKNHDKYHALHTF